MPTSQDWPSLARRLMSSVGTEVPPIAITFSAAPPEGVEAFDDPMPPPTPDGRTGRVSAGCVFWMKSTDRTFTTVAADHGNCSVGSLTHGFQTLEEVAGNADVAALLECNWVTMDVVPLIPVVSERPGAVTYGPLAETPIDPDVVLMRVTARQMMVLSDALPDLELSGKPQCHIVAVAKEQGRAAGSVGCQLSRVRTGMSNAELTCAIPASQLPDVLDRIAAAEQADDAVASYASEDARRWPPGGGGRRV
ncbi:MAG: DUF169 domain-containing protein [Chloroflexi bacterium]|nr:DUF169 domain-containing protein [Chloroflexota bacterium]